MPEHMDVEWGKARIDYHCRPMWIPVKEKYPDKQGVYLVTVLNCTTMATYIIDGFGRSYFNILGVTAWMPLPKPWEGEENETD